jgi:hypothetical protein
LSRQRRQDALRSYVKTAAAGWRFNHFKPKGLAILTGVFFPLYRQAKGSGALYSLFFS